MDLLLEICGNYAEKWKMEFNPKKSLSYSTDAHAKDNFILNGVFLDQKAEFVYLGLPVGSAKNVENFWIEKFKDVEKALYSLNCIGFFPHKMSAKCLSFVYKTYCQSIFSYGLELCFISKKVLELLESRQSTLIKSNLGLSKFA